MQIEQTVSAAVAVSDSGEEHASPPQSPSSGDEEARQGLLKASCAELCCCAPQECVAFLFSSAVCQLAFPIPTIHPLTRLMSRCQPA
jgi:hypothetical protein